MATPTGPKRLADLQLGEAVLAMDPATGALAFSPVHMWSSRRPGQAAEVLTVHTDAGLNLTGGLSWAGSWEAGWYCKLGWAGFAVRFGSILQEAGLVADMWLAVSFKPRAMAA